MDMKLGFRRRYIMLMMGSTFLAGAPANAFFQTEPAPQKKSATASALNIVGTSIQDTVGTAPAENDNIIRTISVTGAQRLEPATVRSYVARQLRIGGSYTQQKADQAIKDLFSQELFKDVSIRNDNGNVVIEVIENPVINRVLIEGNKRIKDDKIYPEIRLAPRQIFTRSKVRADVARIIELYKRRGRYAATVDPKMVQLDQNRVDIIFEVNEGPRSKVRKINIIGNKVFSDSKLRQEMVTKQSRFFRFFSSSDSYDPDRLAFDQQKLRQFYLTGGYADFRVVSAVAELTPDKRDFIITYVVEEGERYKFGEVDVDSRIRDLSSDALLPLIGFGSGDDYNAKRVEDTVESLTETAGLLGYAFADVGPRFERNKETLTMDVTFEVAEARRTYVERIDINGNSYTRDKVVRREFRLNEGDAFNSFLVRRSSNRIRSLGFFQEDFEIAQVEGGEDDRIVLEANVEQVSTGELQLSAGFSSVENFIFQASVRQRNFRGLGQELRASFNISNRSRSIDLGFTEPYLFDTNIALAGDVFRRDFDSFNFVGNQRETTFEQTTTGFQIRAGVPISEFFSVSLRYSLNVDDVTLGRRFFTDDGNGNFTCNPVVAGRFLCDAIGNRTTSSVGFSLIYDTRNNRIRPTNGHFIVTQFDFAGVGGSVKYLRSELTSAKYWRPFGNFIFSLTARGGYIHALENRGSAADGIDDIRLTDRFFLGEPEFRGFDIRGVGPRVIRFQTLPGLDENNRPINAINREQVNAQDDAIGGRAYYLTRAELEIPLGGGGSSLGIRPSIFADLGAVFNVTRPILQNPQRFDTLVLTDANGEPVMDDNGNVVTQLQPLYLTVDDNGNPVTTFNQFDSNGNERTPATIFSERFFGDTVSPRLTVGFGVNWNSPFGPFRINISRDIISKDGDDTKSFSFNVGGQF